MTATNPASAVRDHLAGVQNFDFDVMIARTSRWTVLSGDLRHPMDAQQAYRFIMQAWDFPIAAARLTDTGEGRVRAELKLDNGNNYQKLVSAEYHVDDGLIVEVTFRDCEAVLTNG